MLAPAPFFAAKAPFFASGLRARCEVLLRPTWRHGAPLTALGGACREAIPARRSRSPSLRWGDPADGSRRGNNSGSRATRVALRLRGSPASCEQVLAPAHLWIDILLDDGRREVLLRPRSLWRAPLCWRHGAPLTAPWRVDLRNCLAVPAERLRFWSQLQNDCDSLSP